MGSGERLPITDLPTHVPFTFGGLVTVMNSYRVTGELSCVDELPDGFLDRPRWLPAKRLKEKIL